MLFIRRSATIAVLTVLACTVTLLGDVSQVRARVPRPPRTSSVSPTTACTQLPCCPPRATGRIAPGAARTVGKPRVNLPMRPGSVFSYPNRGKKKQVAIRKRILNTIKSTWGGRAHQLWAARPRNGRIRIATWTFDDWAIARALVRGPQPRRQRPGARGQGPQQAPPAVEVAAQAPAPLALPAKGHPETAEPVELRPPVPGLLSGPRRHPALEVLPVLQRRRDPRAHDHDADLDEPDHDGLRGPVEPGDDHLAPRRATAAFSRIFAESRRDRPVVQHLPPVRHRRRCRASSSPAPARPAPTTRSCVRCATCTARARRPAATRRHRTQIRIIQYAMYSDRGVWIAKRLKRAVERGLQHQDHLRA